MSVSETLISVHKQVVKVHQNRTTLVNAKRHVSDTERNADCAELYLAMTQEGAPCLIQPTLCKVVAAGHRQRTDPSLMAGPVPELALALARPAPETLVWVHLVFARLGLVQG